MNNNTFTYFKSNSQQGVASLEEIVANFESEQPSFCPKTWVKGPKDLYWANLEYSREVALALHWDYIDSKGEKHCKTRGEVLASLFACKLIRQNTQVKLSAGFAWKKFRTTVLFESVKREKPEFYGVVAHRPDWRYRAAAFIDRLCYSFLPVLVSLFFTKPLFYAVVVIALAFPLLPSFLEACCVSCWGRTIGVKVVRLYILNSQGKKLSFTRAFWRQWASNFFWIKEYSGFWRTPEIDTSPFGATKWDRENGCVVTKQQPIK